MKFIDDIVDRVTGQTLDRLIPLAEQQLTVLRTDALAMIGRELPVIAGAMVKEVFNHTQLDEAGDRVIGFVDDVLDKWGVKR